MSRERYGRFGRFGHFGRFGRFGHQEGGHREGVDGEQMVILVILVVNVGPRPP